MFTVSNTWKTTFPNARAGILVMHDVTNPPHHPNLEIHKQHLQDQLRSRFAGQDRNAIAALAPIQAYNAYLRPFKKSYHVQLQLESVVFKGKALPTVAALVEAMFMAEIKNGLLTAGHDLDTLQLPIVLDVATGQERYTLLRGHEQVLKLGDMLMADQEGVISSVVYGPDRRTRIIAETRSMVFTVYAPAGIDEQAVLQHLQDIRQNVFLVSPEARLERLEVFVVQ